MYTPGEFKERAAVLAGKKLMLKNVQVKVLVIVALEFCAVSFMSTDQ